MLFAPKPDHAPDPVTATLARLAHRDEARHVAFGTEHMRYVFEHDPAMRPSLAGAVERRSQVLASISGLSPYVHDALVVFAGGGVSIAQVRTGAQHVATLHREMDRAHRERLQLLGFEVEIASQMSAIRKTSCERHSCASCRWAGRTAELGKRFRPEQNDAFRRQSPDRMFV